MAFKLALILLICSATVFGSPHGFGHWPRRGCHRCESGSSGTSGSVQSNTNQEATSSGSTGVGAGVDTGVAVGVGTDVNVGGGAASDVSGGASTDVSGSAATSGSVGGDVATGGGASRCTTCSSGNGGIDVSVGLNLGGLLNQIGRIVTGISSDVFKIAEAALNSIDLQVRVKLNNALKICINLKTEVEKSSSVIVRATRTKVDTLAKQCADLTVLVSKTGNANNNECRQQINQILRVSASIKVQLNAAVVVTSSTRATVNALKTQLTSLDKICVDLLANANASANVGSQIDG